MLEVTSREFSKVENDKKELMYIEEERRVGFEVDVVDTIKKLKELSASIEHTGTVVISKLKELALSIANHNKDLEVMEEAKIDGIFDHDLPKKLDVTVELSKVYEGLGEMLKNLEGVKD